MKRIRIRRDEFFVRTSSPSVSSPPSDGTPVYVATSDVATPDVATFDVATSNDLSILQTELRVLRNMVFFLNEQRQAVESGVSALHNYVGQLNPVLPTPLPVVPDLDYRIGRLYDFSRAYSSITYHLSTSYGAIPEEARRGFLEARD